MSGINIGRVVVGGLVAGLVMNVGEYILNEPLLGAELTAALEARNLPAVGGGAIGVFVTMTFAFGILLVWLYAAVRPRLGPGPKTAVTIGVVVWFLAYFGPTVAMNVMGMLPGRLAMIGAVWGLVEVPLAALAGAWMYHEA
ncbi:MAG: hypothetical protein QF463_01170 [Vicinamibacterales bacterium]|jgi:hypothetical protein|nr:hypothetical protein [Acidobacteriota bacterium]MDP6372284.1 hypothetical protein [Vicinamibacterales bacterium]MDP6607659.1 hypothetical protein [Vicinamibacterales bacterium]HAK54759.1 hypothetical protein [Acidobacteriota bacterium]|tara:strand:- start:19140 stop:19562 length:423 start_codon:yes stop_codon:yes gene_type:complete